MANILLMAYQISPTRGSEYAVGWNFSINLAKRNKVYVLCGASGDHLGDTKEIEDFFIENPNPNIILIPIKPSALATNINNLNKAGLTPAFYLSYNLWHKRAYKAAKTLLSTERIDIIHHLNPIGFREPGYLWKLNKPFIWGPIGGAVEVSSHLLEELPFKQRFFFTLKNKVNLLQLKHDRRIRKASDKASKIIFCNSENRNFFEKFLSKSGPIFSEQGSSNFNLPNNEDEKASNEKISLVWAGHISHRKNLQFLLKALSLVNCDSKWTLGIVGDGNGVLKLKRLANELQISNQLKWYGRQSREDTISIMQASDLHCLVSLVEGNPAVLYEAISAGVPTISFDQDGMHDTLKGGNGLLIPVTTLKNTLQAYAAAIENLIDNPTELEILKLRTKALAPLVTWEKKIEAFEEIYRDAINK